MLRRLALFFLSAQALAAPRTDEVVQAREAEPTLATLYLRADGALDANGRTAIARAAELVARLPGATLAIEIEPRDQNANGLASTLASLPTTSARLALLSRLVERNAARWAQRDVVERAAGLPPTSAPLLRRRTFERALPTADALAFLGRPKKLRAPGRAELELAGVVDPAPELVDALAEAEALPDGVGPQHHVVTGIAGHRIVLPWRAPRDACAPLDLLGRLDTEGRLRIEVAAEVDPAAKPGVQVIARALRRATPATQLTLVRLACDHPLRTLEEAAWVLTAAGIDPVTPGLLDGPVPAQLPPSPGPLLDGAPTTFLDALSLQRPPSLRHRMATPDPRR